MKKSIKYISLILSLLFVIAGTVMVAYASPDAGDPNTGGDEIVDPVPEPDPDPVPEPDPEPEPDPVPVPDPEPDPDPVPDDTYQDTDPDPVPDDTYQEPVYYDEDPIWYGDASQYSYNTIDDSDSVTGSVSDYAELYDASGMSDADAAPNKWSDITLDEKNVKTGVANFASIKSNTDAADNGHWILILGYVLIALSVLGILYFTVSTVAQRKANKRAKQRRPLDGTEGHADRRAPERPQHRSGHYADGYDYAPRASRRVSSKADTAEIYIPRRAK